MMGKVHFRLYDEGSYCGIETSNVTEDIKEVNCLRCLKVLLAQYEGLFWDVQKGLNEIQVQLKKVG